MRVWVYECKIVWVYECMNVWVYDVRVYECMSVRVYASLRLIMSTSVYHSNHGWLLMASLLLPVYVYATHDHLSMHGCPNNHMHPARQRSFSPHTYTHACFVHHLSVYVCMRDTGECDAFKPRAKATINPKHTRHHTQDLFALYAVYGLWIVQKHKIHACCVFHTPQRSRGLVDLNWRENHNGRREWHAVTMLRCYDLVWMSLDQLQGTGLTSNQRRRRD